MIPIWLSSGKLKIPDHACTIFKTNHFISPDLIQNIHWVPWQVFGMTISWGHPIAYWNVLISPKDSHYRRSRLFNGKPTHHEPSAIPNRNISRATILGNTAEGNWGSEGTHINHKKIHKMIKGNAFNGLYSWTFGQRSNWNFERFPRLVSPSGFWCTPFTRSLCSNHIKVEQGGPHSEWAPPARTPQKCLAGLLKHSCPSVPRAGCRCILSFWWSRPIRMCCGWMLGVWIHPFHIRLYRDLQST